MVQLSADRAFAQNYFEFISSVAQDQSSLASNNVKQFGKTEIPEPAEQKKLLQSFKASKDHDKKITALLDLQLSSLNQAASLIRAGYNMLCYGYGRKSDLIESMARSQFDDYSIFSCYGFSDVSLNLGPTANFSHILSMIYTSIFPGDRLYSSQFASSSSSKNSLLARAEALSLLLSKQNCSILLVLHQMDSSVFRSPTVFSCLEILLASNSVSIIASIDNPNIVNLFTHDQFERLNWVWADCTTMMPYQDELNRFVFDACKASSSKQTPRAAVIVLQSLTSNSRSIFKLLAAFQLSLPEAEVAALIESLEDDEDASRDICTQNSANSVIGMAYHALFQKCQENFVVTAEANFRTQLTEFTDHDLFKSTECRDGSIIYFIPFVHSELKQIMQDI